MSAWTHSICYLCYVKHEGERPPVQLKQEWRNVEVCCFCGELTGDGIYYRHDPANLLCKGKHKDDE